MSEAYTCALTIAGSDPSGGAGIQADLKTFSALGCYGMAVITALTAQNTQGVYGINAVPAGFVKLQLETLYQDISVTAVKTGMLHNALTIQTIADFFAQHNGQLVVDPVLTAKDGSLLLEDVAYTALKKSLLAVTTLLTPNLPEAEILLQKKILSRKEMEFAARKLAEMGPQAVLIKGGHLASEQSNDCFYDKVTQEMIWFNAPRIVTSNTHGTGCTLSAAITALLAHGLILAEAVKQAKAFLFGALEAGANYQLGHGHGPVHHFYQLWK